ncbi:hypothetical protein NAI59_09730, partial [Francisella tularensis subsp. holarctica]|uniref:hypothetical protein n=1 Tax=Francisella tularensis TaxID=263 RepID=UPI002381C7B6
LKVALSRPTVTQMIVFPTRRSYALIIQHFFEPIKFQISSNSISDILSSIAGSLSKSDSCYRQFCIVVLLTPKSFAIKP